jgi:protein-tyrosine-phosphatase/DNA-binding HxlR family transcriptional regulator
VDDQLTRRAEVHAALGDPSRLAIVDELAVSDRSPSELSERFGLPTNLLAHHLSILERVGLIERSVSSGDRRRRYVRLRTELLADLVSARQRRAGSALFLCTHNSARSQLAAALWRKRTGHAAMSAGTHPATSVHPGAVAAAGRHQLPLGAATPRLVEAAEFETAQYIVSVCDRAHEEMDLPPRALHWSIPDPVDAPDPRAFDSALALLEQRISALIPHATIGALPPTDPYPTMRSSP